jgi:hypothetical protein
MIPGLGKTRITEVGLGVESPSPGLATIGHAIAVDRIARVTQKRLVLPPGDLESTNSE